MTTTESTRPVRFTSPENRAQEAGCFKVTDQTGERYAVVAHGDRYGFKAWEIYDEAGYLVATAPRFRVALEILAPVLHVAPC
jgi:hypothetical protein